MSSEELIDYLLKGLIEDSTYRVNGIPHDLEERRGLIRSLMNVRDARPIPPDLLRIQDKYLEERRKELGTVSVEDIPAIEESLGSTGPFSDRISVWRGDITLLGCDAIVNAANCYMLGCFQPCHACIDNCIHTYAGMQMRLECDAFMRGRTLNSAFVILDEAQNATIEQMKMFLTRLGFESKAVITGDLTQTDLGSDRPSGLKHALNILDNIDGIAINRFNEKDIVRHPLVQKIVLAYENSEKAEKGEDKVDFKKD